MLKPLLIGTFILLVVAVSFSLLPQKERPFFSPRTPLSGLLDQVNARGWTSADQPLGETEFISKEVAKTLKFDDAIYRVYRRGDVEVGVYAAYWKPGKLDPWLIALHTPDSCWVLAGAEMLARDDHKVIRVGMATREAMFRQFLWPSKERMEVVFWHLYGGDLSGFPVTGEEGRLRARWRELLITLRNTEWGRVRKEQVFVRISTNQTIAELTASDLWPALVEALAPTGIVQRGSAQLPNERD